MNGAGAHPALSGTATFAAVAGLTASLAVLSAAGALRGAKSVRAGRRLTSSRPGSSGRSGGRWSNRAPLPPVLARLLIGSRVPPPDRAPGPDVAAIHRLVALAWLAAAGAAMLAAGPAFAAGVTILGIPAARSALRAHERRLARKLDAQLPLLLDELARGLRTGASLTQSFADAAAVLPPPIRGHALSVVHLARHDRLQDALLRWTERVATDAARSVATALCIGLEVGGVNARSVEAVAASQRDRAAIAAEARALASQARLSALVMTIAPLVFCALLVGSDPAASAFLLRSPVGLSCLATGVLLDVVAARWMAAITRVR